MAYIKYNMQCPKCDSSRGYGVDDKGWGHCFKCGHRQQELIEDDLDDIFPVSGGVALDTTEKADTGAYNASQVVFKAITSRKLLLETCEKYGVGFAGDDLVFPYKQAEKVRKNGDKDFTIRGQWSESPELFGQHRFPSGLKYVLVVEGELDALSAYQMLGNGKYPVACVSVRNGVSSALKDCKQNFDWLDSFENVVFCFDNDQPGHEAQLQCAELFSHKAKCMVANEGFKDANDYLTQNHTQDFVDAFWRAERFVPDGIVAGDSNELYQEVMKPVERSDVDYPFHGLNELTYGIRKGELVTVTAGSGLGKSQFLREIIHHILNDVDAKIGLMFLEESTRKTGLSIMSLAANQPLHLPDSQATLEEKQKAYDATLGTGRLFLFNHFGSTEIDNIINRVRYFAKVLGCQYIFLDHISIVVSAQTHGDERKALDEIVTKLRMLVQETGVALICVSHLKRPDSKGHEDGAATSLSQLRGSGSIAQLSDMVIGLERNGQAEDTLERNTTRVRVLKNRFCGITGPACNLLYEHDSGRMKELEDEETL